MNNAILKEDVRLFAQQFELWEQLRGKAFLITGATGLIGSVMIKCLLELNRKRELGIKIKAIVRNLEKAQSIFFDDYKDILFYDIPLVQINANNISNDVDYIVHLASPTASRYFVEHPVETLRTAIDGTTAVLDYAKEANVEGFVYASSLEIYGSNDNDNIIDENYQGYINPLDIRSSYSMGKRASECLCHTYAKEYGVNAVIARLTQTFGAGISVDDNRVFAQFARSIIKGENIVLHTKGKSAKPYCYTTDAVEGMLYLLLRGERGEAYNVANKDTYISILEMAKLVSGMFDPHPQVIIDIDPTRGYAPHTQLRLNTNKIEELGWSPKYELKKMYERLIMSIK